VCDLYAAQVNEAKLRAALDDAAKLIVAIRLEITKDAPHELGYDCDNWLTFNEYDLETGEKE
jgi:hypothetical protein